MKHLISKIVKKCASFLKILRNWKEHWTTKTKIELKWVFFWLFRWSIFSKCDQTGKTNEKCDFFSSEIIHRKIKEIRRKNRFADQIIKKRNRDKVILKWRSDWRYESNLKQSFGDGRRDSWVEKKQIVIIGTDHKTVQRSIART